MEDVANADTLSRLPLLRERLPKLHSLIKYANSVHGQNKHRRNECEGHHTIKGVGLNQDRLAESCGWPDTLLPAERPPIYRPELPHVGGTGSCCPLTQGSTDPQVWVKILRGGKHSWVVGHFAILSLSTNLVTLPMSDRKVSVHADHLKGKVEICTETLVEKVSPSQTMRGGRQVRKQEPVQIGTRSSNRMLRKGKSQATQ